MRPNLLIASTLTACLCAGCSPGPLTTLRRLTRACTLQRMAVREGQMDVRVKYEPGVRGAALLAQVAEAVDSELAKSGEHLVLLLSERVTGIGAGVNKPWRTYKGVKYVAAPRDPEPADD